MSDAHRTSRAARPSRGLVTLVCANIASLVGLGLARWTYSGPTNSPACDVYCGPVASILLALALVVLAIALWGLAVIRDLVIVIGRRPHRHWAAVGLSIQMVPVAVLIVMASAGG